MTFNVQTFVVPGMTAKDWAEGFGLQKPLLIAGITADGAAKRPAYAARSAGFDEDGQATEEVHVWFVRRGSRGFHMWASAPPAQFSLFERDFTRIFGAVGVEGDLFPLLRGGKDTCST